MISHGEDDGSREAGGAGREAPAPAVARTEGATDASRERVPGLPTLGSTPRHGRAAHAGGDAAEGIGSVIDERYVITDLLSAGRTGAVYLARQTRPVPRTVAIKVIPESRGASGVIIRYERERARLDRLEHPGIARMLEVGLTTSGSGCFVMEYARGSPIVKYCDQRRLAPGERLGLVAQVCRAVEFAHQKGVIHGGLWPSNVMVCDAEGPPLAKVLDFGLARATEPDGGESHPFDRRPASHLVPEQVGPLAADIDTRADVYALGAMLYELLSGSTPLDSGSVSGREGIEAAFREDPPTPSLRLRRSRAGEDIARARGGTVSRLSRWMSGDLDAIVMKALSRDRGRRYATVGEFRADIERFVAGEPVGARPVGAGSRAVKFARRNRVAAAVTGLALAGLMAGVIGMARGWIETKGRRETAERARWSAAVSAREMGLRRESSRRHEAEATNRRSHEALEVFTEEVMGRIPAGRRERTPEEVSVLRGVSAQWELIAESRGEAAEARSRRARALDELSRIRDRQGRPEESLALAREALALWTALADEYPRESEYRRRQGEGQRGIAGRTRARGDLAESERESMLAVSVFRGLGDDEPGDRRLLAASLADLAAVCRDRAHWAEAERASREGAAILDGLIEADPEEGNVGLREEAADSHRDLGLSLRRLGQGEAAESEYRLALAIWDRVASSSPDDAAKTRRRAAGIGRELGVLLIELGRADEAEGVLAGAVEELRRLVASNPSRTASLSELARCRRDQARALGALGRSVEAEGAVREAIAIGEGLVARRPEVPAYRVGLGLSHVRYGTMARSGSSPAEGLVRLGNGIEILSAACEMEPDSVPARAALRKAHGERAAAREDLGRTAEAVEDWDRAIALGTDRETARFQSRRAMARAALGDLDRAIDEMNASARIHPIDPSRWYRLACLHARKVSRDPEDAEGDGKKAVEHLMVAVRAGFEGWAAIERSADLASIRGRADYRAWIASVRDGASGRGGAGAPP